METQFAADAVAQYVFQVIAYAETLESIEALNECFRDPLQRLGIQLFACLRIVESVDRCEIEALFGEGFGAWAGYYRRMRFAEDDPIIQEVERTADPFYWTEIVRSKPLSLRALRVIAAARQFQLYDGFVSPIRNSNGALSFVLFAGNGVNSKDPYARTSALLLAYYYGRFGQRIYRASKGKLANGVLSERQRQCLRWVRAGKSSKDIGDILGISATVVDEHIGKACERLKVRTRVQAIFEASRRGLELSDP